VNRCRLVDPGTEKFGDLAISSIEGASQRQANREFATVRVVEPAVKPVRFAE
jgi:hypothetical protein